MSHEAIDATSGELRIAHWVDATFAEGPHLRCALWVQGCSLGCAGCCNPELFAPSGGVSRSVGDLLRDIAAARRCQEIEGLTLLGGEPLEQSPHALAALCRGVQALGLGIIVFTGYTLEQASVRPGFEAWWPHIDTLVDGPFRARAREPSTASGGRRFIGSRNQRLHHRTRRYALPELWHGPNCAEFRIDTSGNVTAHGFPAVLTPLARDIRITARARS